MATELTLDWNTILADPVQDKPSDTLSAADALVASLRTFASVDMAFIASNMGVSEEEAAQALGDAVYLDPVCRQWLSSDEYLSGNLYEKLKNAREAARADNSFARNVAALEEALPPRVPHEAIYLRLGAPWVPEEVIASFVRHLMNNPYSRCQVLHDPTTGSWSIKNKGSERRRPESTHVWGTPRMPALNIVEHTLNGTPVRLYDEVDSPDTKSGTRRVLNREETMLATEKELALQEEFSRWAWSDQKRRKRLVDLYNERYCGYRQRHYDGSILNFPGMSKDIKLRPHQSNAAMRILLERDVLVAHDVGAGKTYTAIAAIMELRRMGISHKNLVVVPNNVMGQWSALFSEMYPNAKVLTVSPRGFTPSKRLAVLRAMRDEDFDAILMSYSSFNLVKLSRKEELRALDVRIDELAEIMRDPKRRTPIVKREKAALAKKREKIAAEVKDTPDDLTFDNLGITRIFVDEAQNFKNLSLGGARYRAEGLGRTGSATCTHMHNAIRCVQRAGGGAIFLSGTIMTNSIADLYVLQTYLQSGTLELLGLRSFDAWTNMFARKVSGFEIDVDTSTFRHTQRYGGFGNLGELASILSNVADFHRLDAADGLPSCDGRTNVLVHKSPALRNYLHDISKRAELVRAGRVRTSTDNLLKICTDGRKAAIDVRLVVEDAYVSSQTSKISACADNIFRIWQDGTDGQLTQIVFCDSSTPKAEFNVYDELKDELANKGIPPEQIAFVHDAKTERERSRLFAAMRAGKVRVLLGSTFKLGLGVNVQDRLVAAHHLDVPWRPADMVQREGRILRQGNRNPHVQIFRYVTEGSFDAYSWQILENKQRVIDELLAGTYEGRFIESDVGDAALSYAEIKALAVNNPLLKERVEVANELEHHLIMHRRSAYAREEMRSEIQEKTQLIELLEEMEQEHAKDLAHVKARGTGVNDTEARNRMRTLVPNAIAGNAWRPHEYTLRGYYRGFSVILPKNMDPNHPYVWLSRNARHRVDLKGARPVGIPIRMDHVIDRIGDEVRNLNERIAALYHDWETLEEELASTGDDHSAQIASLRARLAKIDIELEKRSE